MPSIKLKPFNNYKATEFKIKIDKKIVDQKIQEIADQNKQFEDKKENEKSILGDQVTFDYSATINNKKFDGSEGKGVQLEIGRNLFLQGFDEQLINVKKGETKIIISNLPPNHPNKELANKKTNFECKILKIKKPVKKNIDDNFAKSMGAQNLSDLKSLIEKQISSQYQAIKFNNKRNSRSNLEKP